MLPQVLQLQIQILAVAMGVPPPSPVPPDPTMPPPSPMPPESVKLIQQMADAAKKMAQKLKAAEVTSKTILKKIGEGEEFKKEDIEHLLKNKPFREEIGLEGKSAIGKLIDRLATQYQYNSKLIAMIDKNTNSLMKEIAKEYGEERAVLSEAILQGDTETLLPQSMNTRERYEFAVARFHLYLKRYENVKDQLSPLKLVGETIHAAVPLVSAIVWTLNPDLDLALDLLLEQNLNKLLQSTELESAFEKVASQPINAKILDKTDGRNKIGAAHKLGIAKVLELIPDKVAGLEKARSAAKLDIQEARKLKQQPA